MKTLFILYDAECELCRRLQLWLQRQPAFVPVRCIPLQSEETARRFPGIEQLHPEERMLAISDAGEVWRGSSAWITSLWALQEYREWATRLANPALRPFARVVCDLVSQNRRLISGWFPSSTNAQIQQRLGKLANDAAGKCGAQCQPPPLPRGIR